MNAEVFLQARAHKKLATVTANASELKAALTKLDQAAAGLARWAEALPGVLRCLNEALTQLDDVVGRHSEEPRVFDIAYTLHADQKRIMR